ncbi:hypothetical protein [Deinococcus roseus]|uniref:Uncharacterized protein n=1 Tax=Deinococcus roseus TaxID=392414 RepID=A0ABQ2DBB6_9DEIO|nr:hypothetical protein [Deinococcus roseus]GGJ51680.1 hypothetical protein GCM10008938_42100 [Deinococcus roseus]
MARLKDPRAEKERDYQHQRVIVAQYPHLYVKARRKKKHGTSRSHRRRTRQALQANDGAQDYAEIDSIDRKDNTMHYDDQTAPLRTALQYKVQRRARTEAYRKTDAVESSCRTC